MAEVTRWKAWVARWNFHRWLEAGLLVDPVQRPGNHAWEKAVEIVQQVFPSTEAWLMSCSSGEGGHGRFVLYAGRDYSPGVEETGIVGGWMQYRWPTFKGHFRRALDALRTQGFQVEEHLRDPSDVRVWLSPLGQAIAAGWARWSGEDNEHWIASWSNGCR